MDTAARPLTTLLHALIGKSLVRAETTPSGEQRFVLLETIREYAIEQLRAHGEEALLRERHYAAYLQFFRTADSHMRGAEAAACQGRFIFDPDRQGNLTHLAIRKRSVWHPQVRAAACGNCVH
jgi:predicted ATPase